MQSKEIDARNAGSLHSLARGISGGAHDVGKFLRKSVSAVSVAYVAALTAFDSGMLLWMEKLTAAGLAQAKDVLLAVSGSLMVDSFLAGMLIEVNYAVLAKTPRKGLLFATWIAGTLSGGSLMAFDYLSKNVIGSDPIGNSLLALTIGGADLAITTLAGKAFIRTAAD